MDCSSPLMLYASSQAQLCAVVQAETKPLMPHGCSTVLGTEDVVVPYICRTPISYFCVESLGRGAKTLVRTTVLMQSCGNWCCRASRGPAGRMVRHQNHFAEVLQHQYLGDIESRITALQQSLMPSGDTTVDSTDVRDRLLAWYPPAKAVVIGAFVDSLALAGTPTAGGTTAQEVAVEAVVQRVCCTDWGWCSSQHNLTAALDWIQRLHSSGSGQPSSAALPEVV